MRKQEIQQIYARYYRPDKNPQYQWPDIPKHSKKRGVLVWNSYHQGTYVRSIHGELKHS